MNKFSYSTLELANSLDIRTQKNSTYILENIKNVGLTGASGFLGLYLIDQFSRDSHIKKIKCFIRSKDNFDNKKKVLGLNFNENKIEFHYALNPNNTNDLDLLIHSAAQVHNIKNLSSLYNDNVKLTKEVVNNANCPIVYISTLSVYASSNILGMHLPAACVPSKEHFIYGGYAQSKLLGEYLTEQRNDTKIIRLGLLTPSSCNPVLQNKEFFTLFLKLLKNFPYYPENYEESFVDISPVDLVCEHIYHHLQSSDKYIHIANKNKTSICSFIKALNLSPISQDAWNKYTETLSKTEKILLNYAYFKTKTLQAYPHYFNIDLFQSTGHNWLGNIVINDIEKYIKNIYEKI